MSTHGLSSTPMWPGFAGSVEPRQPRPTSCRRLWLRVLPQATRSPRNTRQDVAPVVQLKDTSSGEWRRYYTTTATPACVEVFETRRRIIVCYVYWVNSAVLATWASLCGGKATPGETQRNRPSPQEKTEEFFCVLPVRDSTTGSAEQQVNPFASATGLLRRGRSPPARSAVRIEARQLQRDVSQPFRLSNGDVWHPASAPSPCGAGERRAKPSRAGLRCIFPKRTHKNYRTCLRRARSMVEQARAIL